MAAAYGQDFRVILNNIQNLTVTFTSEFKFDRQAFDRPKIDKISTFPSLRRLEPGKLKPGELEPGRLEPGGLEPGGLEPGTRSGIT